MMKILNHNGRCSENSFHAEEIGKVAGYLFIFIFI